MEFRPKILDEQTIMFLIGFPFIVLSTLFILFSTTSLFNNFMGSVSIINKILILEGAIVLASFCLIMLYNYFKKGQNIIKVTKENLFIKRDKIINSKIYTFSINDIKSVRFKWDTIGIGQTLTKYLYWIIVRLNSGKEVVIEMHAFDSATLKKALHYIALTFPSIEVQPKYIATKPWKGEFAELFHAK